MSADPIASTSDVYTSRQVKTLDDKELQEILLWIDKIPLSREKRNLTRDMSDGVPVAELVKHFLPKLVELHQYTPSNGTQAKEKNWFHLNRTGLGGQSPVALKRSDMIQKSVVEQQRKQIQEQNKTIDVLTANILKLEHIIHLKDIRIDDLSARLEKAGLQVPRDPASLTDRRPMPGASTDRTKPKPAQPYAGPPMTTTRK